MTKSSMGLILAVLVGAAGGCGKEEPAPPPTCTTLLASCNLASSDFCMDVCNAIMPSDQTDCTNGGGTWTAGVACSTANLQGTCAVANPTPPQVIDVRFYTPTWASDAQAQAACAQMGGTYAP